MSERIEPVPEKQKPGLSGMFHPLFSAGLAEGGIVRVGKGIGLGPIDIFGQGGAATRQEQPQYGQNSYNIFLSKH